MNREQFKQLFDRYFDTIRSYLYYRSGNTELAGDLAQECFMRVWEKELQVNGEKDLGLLYKIASDLFISHYRREKLRMKMPERISFEVEGESPEDQLAYQELQRSYEVSLAKLPEKQRVAFLMSRHEELSYADIATRLSISPKAVEKRMSAALAALRKELKTGF